MIFRPSVLSLTLIALAIPSVTFSKSVIDERIVGHIEDKKINEVSGMVSSRMNQGVLWALNDSGNNSHLYALQTNGQLITTLKIEGVENRDWEDLARFTHQGKDYLLIADVGDNRAKRSEYSLYAVAKPELHRLSQSDKKQSVTPQWSITFTYEDGPRDCEAIAVDSKRNTVLLLSKRDNPPVLYELELAPAKNAIAKRLGSIPPLPKNEQQSGFSLFDYSAQPTAMDISPDGLSIAVLTYDSSFLFQTESHESWLEVLSSKPIILKRPPLKQAEALAFSADGQSIFITSEKIPAPIVQLSIAKD